MGTHRVQGTGHQPKPVKTKPEAKMPIENGTSVDSVKTNGSKGQKLAANLFDVNKDGVYNEYEAKDMNNCVFTAGKKSLTITDRSRLQENPAITEIKYGDHQEVLDDKLNTYQKGFLSLRYSNPDESSGLYFGTCVRKEGGKVTIDLPKNEVNVENANMELLASHADKVNVKNSDIENISTNEGSLNLKNVKDKGIIYDSATKIRAAGKTDIVTDKNSKVDIERE